MRCNPYMSQLDPGADFNAFVHGLEREARAEGPKRRPEMEVHGYHGLVSQLISYAGTVT